MVEIKRRWRYKQETKIQASKLLLSQLDKVTSAYFSFHIVILFEIYLILE